MGMKGRMVVGSAVAFVRSASFLFFFFPAICRGISCAEFEVYDGLLELRGPCCASQHPWYSVQGEHVAWCGIYSCFLFALVSFFFALSSLTGQCTG